MGDPQSKNELLAFMASGRRDWDELLSRLSDQDLKQPGVEGVWSIKDILAHICSYQQYMAATLVDQQAHNGQATAALDSYYQTHLTLFRAERPDLPEQISQVRGEQVNTVFVAASRYKLPAEVRRMEADAYQTLLQQVQAAPDSVLAQPINEAGVTFLQIIPKQCYLHYQTHAPIILNWLEARGSA